MRTVGRFLLGSLSSFFTAIAIILLIFVHVGQVRDYSLPIRVSLITVDTTNIGTTTGSYGQGLYSHCRYETNVRPAGCTNVGFFNGQFRPYNQVLADVQQPLQAAYANTFSNTTFGNVGYLERLGQAAFWLIFLGSIFAICAFILGFLPFRITEGLAALFAFLTFVAMLTAAAIWTSIFQMIRYTGGGLQVYYGVANGLLWGVAFAMLFALIGYVIAALAPRKRKERVEEYESQYVPAPVVVAPVAPVAPVARNNAVIAPVAPVAPVTPAYNDNYASNRNTMDSSMIDGRSVNSDRGLVADSAPHASRLPSSHMVGDVYRHDHGGDAPVVLAPTVDRSGSRY